MQIDLFQDTVCPWCRIGKRNLTLALEQWSGEPVTVRYRSFFLNPETPPEGFEFRPYMLAKGNHQIPLEQFFDAPRRMGDAVGLNFEFERIERAPNTLLSHRLIALTPRERQPALIDAIYSAYFEQGRDIGDRATLVEIAAANGHDPATIEARLRSDEAADQVLDDAAWAQQHGIRGVPFFVFEGQFGVSGAQPPEVLLDVLRQVTEHTASGK